jgi:acetylornithine deacetylase/succinyl-diaminopimelate desuccinylase-like protein
VPSYLRLEGDLRSKDTKKYQKVKNSIVQAVTKELSSQNMKVIFHWEPYAFGYEHALKEISYKNLQNIYKSLDINLIPKSTTSGSDAGFLNKIGIKSYCLGDGVIDAHSINERIKIEKFYKLQEIVEKLILFYRK